MAAVRGSGTVTAFVTLTVTYTEAHCPTCHRVIMWLPGNVLVEARSTRTSALGYQGRGPAVVCKRCGDHVEVIAR